MITLLFTFFKEVPIAIEKTNAPVRDDDGPRINEAIKAKQVRLIDHLGENRGIVSIKEALEIASEVGLDLIEISPQANPPVCKVLDFGKYKYEIQKRKNEAKKNQKVVNIKELKLRPAIDTHDYEVKLKQAKKFLSQGDKVKFTLRFKGRELSANNMGKELLDKIIEDLDLIGKVDQAPKLEGRQMSMMLSPV
ncbi:MAG: translation initiation factor IF-3 [Alphaproteobacteria bacterium]|nr:translation initiation factor IF-3 [Alphaproteobacteria bacterium]